MGISTSRRTLPFLAVASVALTAACGVRPPLAPAADAEHATASAEPRQVDPEQFLDDVRAGIDASTRAEVRTDVDTDALTMAGAGVVDWTTSPVTLDYRLDVSSSPGWSDGEVRVVDRVMYLRYGKVKRFVAVDLSSMESLPPELTQVLDLVDPLSGLEDLALAVTEVRSSGTQEVVDDVLHGYDLVVDGTRMDALMGLDMHDVDLPDDLEVDLWVDDLFRLRQVSFALEVDGEAVEMHVVAYAWDDPVVVEAPLDAKVWSPPRDTA